MSKDKNESSDDGLESYQDPAGLTLKEMNFGLWLAENRKKILKLITIILILVSAGLFIYSTYHFIAYFRAGDPNNQIIVDNLNTSPRKLTEDLQLAPINVFVSGERYDLAVKVKNPNLKFLAIFNYCFVQAENNIFCGAGFILPNEEKYILSLGRTDVAGLSDINFVISDIFWQRIDSHQISNWDNYSRDRLNFAISDINFAAAAGSGLSDRVNLNSLAFTIKNDTSFGYYEVPLNIMLFSGSELVGVNRYPLSNFLAGDIRQVKLSWVGNFRSVNRVEVVPEINIMDSTVYSKYQGTGTR
jgi:hypothetical protein